MDKEQRDRTFHWTPLMDIMDIQDSELLHFDVTGKHRKFVEFAFMGAPVVAISPFVDETFDIGERDTIVPAGVTQFVWEAGICKFAMKEGESVVGNGNLEAGFRGHDARRKSEREDIAGWFELICAPELGPMVQMIRLYDRQPQLRLVQC